MALIQCKECKQSISNKANACPHCGAPLNTSGGIGRFLKLLAIAIGTIFILGMLSLCSRSNDITRRSSEAANQPVDYRPEWVYTDTKAKMSGDLIHSADLRSLNKIDLDFPYGPGIGAEISIYSIGDSPYQTMVRIDKGQLLCHSWEDCYLDVKFDDEKSMLMKARGPDNGETEYAHLNAPDARKFIDRVRKSKRVSILMPVYKKSGAIWDFDVSNLNWEPSSGKKH